MVETILTSFNRIWEAPDALKESGMQRALSAFQPLPGQNSPLFKTNISLTRIQCLD
jgi:hypothetical protein